MELQKLLVKSVWLQISILKCYHPIPARACHKGQLKPHKAGIVAESKKSRNKLSFHNYDSMLFSFINYSLARSHVFGTYRTVSYVRAT